jgi:hypothetical protein
MMRNFSIFGAIAQLGERNTGSVEVNGSIPFSSTITKFFKTKWLERIKKPPSGGFFMHKISSVSTGAT